MHPVRLLHQSMPVVLVEPREIRGPRRLVAGRPLHRRQPRPRDARAAGRPERCLQVVSLPLDHELHGGVSQGTRPVAGDRKYPADPAEGGALSTATGSVAAQPVNEDDGPLSPWWIRAVEIVMILGFAGLILITTLSYRNAPPIPARVVDPQGALLFGADDVGDGQAVFLRYGLMANGSIW